ncbi:EamA family transporter [bacterium]|jgi:drug/metabolite transporter (DMT)-like permease|nr:EamA family transporter [bacterium]
MMIWIIPLLYGIWSLAFPIGKTLVFYADPIFTVAIRMLLASLILLGWLYIKNSNSIKISFKEALSTFILSLFSIYFCNIFEYWGLKYLSSAKTCFIYSMSPFFTALLSYIHFKERMTWTKWLGMCVGFLGFLPVLALQEGSEDLLKINTFFSWPSLAVIFASFCGVYGWILLRLMVKDQQMNPVKVNAFSMLFGGALAFITSFIIETSPLTQMYQLDAPPYFGWLALIIFISNIVCFNLYGFLLKKFSATLLSFFGLLSPLFTSLNAYLFFNEPFHPIILLSTVLVSFGLFIVYRIELQQGYVRSSSSD